MIDAGECISRIDDVSLLKLCAIHQDLVTRIEMLDDLRKLVLRIMFEPIEMTRENLLTCEQTDTEKVICVGPYCFFFEPCAGC